MLQNFLRMNFILLSALWVVVLSVRLYHEFTSALTPPRAHFAHASCTRPCWLGIQPGHTHIVDAINILEAQGIVPHVRNRLVEFDSAVASGGFWTLAPNEGTVQGLNLSQQPCPIHILLHYGKPDIILAQPNGAILYFEAGLAVHLTQIRQSPAVYNVEVSYLTEDNMRRYLVDANALRPANRTFRTLTWQQVEPDLRRACA